MFQSLTSFLQLPTKRNGELLMIVGIAGKKRAGKDTIAREFIRRGFQHDSFAAPIRRFIADLIGYEIDDENKEEPKYGFHLSEVEMLMRHWGLWHLSKRGKSDRTITIGVGE